MQLGGSDQWGNIVGGCDLIKKTTGEVIIVMILHVTSDEILSIGSIWTDIIVAHDRLWRKVWQIGWKCIVARLQEDIFCTLKTPASTRVALTLK